MDKAIEKRIERLENEVKDILVAFENRMSLTDMFINKAKEKGIKLYEDDRCPVFLEAPYANTVGYWLAYGKIVCGTYDEFNREHQAKYTDGFFKFEEAPMRYPNNPGVYKYLQIIWRYYGGEPSKEDWLEDGLNKYYLFFVPIDNLWKMGIEELRKEQGTIHMLKEPDIEAIQAEMGNLMEWLK